MNYSYNFGSSFPRKLMPVGTKKDIDDTVKNLITQYYAYIDAGNISAANTLYNDNKGILGDYQIDMAYINRLEEEIYNVGLDVLKKRETIISDSEPVDLADEGYWYKDY